MSTSEDSSSSSDSDMSSDGKSDDESDNSQTMNRPKVDTQDSKSDYKASEESNAKSACCLHNIAIQGREHNLHAIYIILLYKEESIICMLSA